MNKKIIYKIFVSMILLCLIFQILKPEITFAVPVDENGNEIKENIDENQNVTNKDDDNLKSEIDDDTGTMLQPLLELVRALGDSIISVLSRCMLGTNREKVMVKWSELDTSNISESNETKTFSQDEIDEFKDSNGQILNLKYPNFKYTPEEIFKGEVELFGIDFISGNVVKDKKIQQNNSDGWNALRSTVASWYKVLRYIAIVGLLSILIYLGIMIIFSSSSEKKADYKNSIANWVIAMILVFAMHYIMAFVIIVIQRITTLLGDSIGNIKVIFGADKTFMTNFMGLARFQAQQYSLKKQLIYIVIYIVFITLTFKFTFIYFSRTLKMALLTIFAPLVAMIYPLDKKGSGKSRVFSFWLREYTYNALLQPMHLLLYDILIGSAIKISVNNPVYVIVALFYLAEAEKLFKRIFGFNRASGGMVGGLAGSTGALVMASSVWNGTKKLRNTLSQSNDFTLNKKSDSGDKLNEKSDFEEEERQDELFEKKYGKRAREINKRRNSLNIDRSIFDARKGFSEKDFKNIEKDFQPFNANFNYLKKNGTRMGVKGKGWSNENIGAFRQLEISIAKNEKAFSDSKLAFQYNDEFSNMNSNQILMKMKECLKEGKNDEAQKYFDVLKRRMLENKYMSKHGGPKAFIKGRFADFSDSDLAFRYEEAKSNNNKGEILECEAEMALRAKDYSAYESKFDELQMFKLGKNNEDSVENTNIEKETYTSRQTTNTENESNSVRKMKNANRETGISSNNDNIASDTDGESSGVVEAGIKMDNPFKKLFRKNNRKTVREMSQKRNAREMSQKRNSREENNVRSNVNLNMNSVRNIDERENVEEEERGTLNRMSRRTISGIGNVAHQAIKPVWNTNKGVEENITRLGGKIAKGAVATTMGVATTAVQAGISMADGKYTMKEAVTSFAGGYVAGKKVSNVGERFIKDVIRDVRYGDSEEARKKQIARDWAEREDVKKYYKETYGRNSNKMISVAQNYLAREGIQDVNEQQKIIRYANYLRENHKLDGLENSIKQSIQIYRFKSNLDYTEGVPIGKEGRQEYVERMVQQDGSAKTREEVRKKYKDMLNDIDDFENVEDNREYDYLE